MHATCALHDYKKMYTLVVLYLRALKLLGYV
jgi:hypothetical protein